MRILLLVVVLVTSACASFRPSTVQLAGEIEIRMQGEDVDNFVVDGESHVWMLPVLSRYAKSRGIQVEFLDLSEDNTHGRYIRTLDLPMTYAKIEINNTTGSNMQAATFVHELAHAVLPRFTNKVIAEVTAESVAYLVCKRVGLNTYKASLAYLGHFEPEVRTTILQGKQEDIDKAVDLLFKVLDDKR